MRPCAKSAQVTVDPPEVDVDAAAMGKIGRTLRSPLSFLPVLRERLRDGPYIPLGGVWSFECPWGDISSL